MKKIALLVLSCDKYSDLWESYSELFNRFWRDCPYDKYLASNTIEFNSQGFKSILMGPDETWSSGVKIALSKLKDNYDYVFTTLEDSPFLEKVDNNYIVNAFESFTADDGNFLRTYMAVKPKIKPINQYYGEVENNTPYRQTCGYAVWKIKTLYEILDEKETAWDFERIGVKRGYNYDKFYCMHKNQFKLINLVVKGKLLRASYRKLKELIPEVNLNRQEFTIRENIKNNIYAYFVLMALKFIPQKIQNKIYFIRHK
jgi:hypothetical protein